MVFGMRGETLACRLHVVDSTHPQSARHTLDRNKDAAADAACGLRLRGQRLQRNVCIGERVCALAGKSFQPYL